MFTVVSCLYLYLVSFLSTPRIGCTSGNAVEHRSLSGIVNQITIRYTLYTDADGLAIVKGTEDFIAWCLGNEEQSRKVFAAH
jgi:hypothetical protein